MEKVLGFFKRNGYLAAGMLFLAVSFTACKKNDNNYVRTPAAGLMAFNLSPDVAGVAITLSGNNLTNVPLGYTSYTGSYLPVYVGSREVKSFDFNLGTPLATTTQIFADSMYYSLYVVGSNGSYRNVIVNDKLDSLVATPGQAYVRYINAIADSAAAPLVTIAANGSNIVNTNAPFASVSGFTKVGVGNITVGVNDGANIAANRTIAVDDGKIYTILLLGTPAATDSTKKVQIKFIQNGSLTQ